MKELKKIKLKIEELSPTQENPNVMTDKNFEQLVEAIKENGYDQPIVVWLNPETKKYEIVKGNHRYWALKFLNYTEIDCIVGEYKDRDQMLRDLVKDNVVRGKLDPYKFTELYTKLQDKYGKEMMSEMFKFIDERELQKLIREVRDELPDELKAKLDDAKEEIKTVDDLSKILNRLFNEYGNTLECGFMVIDYGGKDSLWIRADKRLWSVVKPLADKVFEQKLNMSDVIYELILTSKTKDDYINLPKKDIKLPKEDTKDANEPKIEVK